MKQNQNLKKGKKVEENTLHWDFKLMTDTEYSLKIITEIKGTMLNYIFVKSRAALPGVIRAKLHEGMPDSVNSFNVPRSYFNYIKTTIHSQLCKIEAEVKADGIHTLNSKIDDCKFIKKDKMWQIQIEMGGMYADKR